MDKNYQSSLNQLIKDFYSNEICLILDQTDFKEISNTNKSIIQIYEYINLSLVNFELLEIQNEFYLFMIDNFKIRDMYLHDNNSILKEYILTNTGFIEFLSLHRNILNLRDFIENYNRHLLR